MSCFRWHSAFNPVVFHPDRLLHHHKHLGIESPPQCPFQLQDLQEFIRNTGVQIPSHHIRRVSQDSQVSRQRRKLHPLAASLAPFPFPERQNPPSHNMCCPQ